MDNSTFEKATLGSYYMIIDQIITYALGFLFWLVIAKLAAPSVVGQVMVATAIAGTVLGFAGYGAQVTISKYIAEYNAKGLTNNAKHVFYFGLKIGLIVAAIAAAILVFLSNQVAAAFSSNDSLVELIIIAMLVFLPSQTIISCFNGAFQGTNKMRFNVFTDLIYQGARLSIAIIMIFAGFGSIGILLGFALGSVVSIIFSYSLFVRKLFRQVVTGVVTTNLRHVVRFSAFNYLSIGLYNLGIQVGYLLLGIQSFDSVAIFGISALISGAVGGIMISVGRVILPTTSEHSQKDSKADLNKIINTAFRFSIIASGFLYIVMIIAPEQILGLLSDKYTLASSSFRILVVAGIISSITGLIESVFNGIGRANRVATIATVSSVTLIASSIVLIPLLNVQGAALSMLNGSLVSIVLCLYYLRKERIISISYWNLLGPATSIICSLLVGYISLIIIGNIFASIMLSVALYALLIKTLRLISYSEIAGLVHVATKSIRLKQE